MHYEDERKGLPSASNLARIALCPGSYLAEQALPDQSTEEASKGTRIHTWLENYYNEKEQPDLQSPEEQELAHSIIEITSKIRSDNDERYAVEIRMWLMDGMREVMSGKPDIIFYTPDTRQYLIVDFKTGNIAADPAEENYQLRSLAVMLAEELHWNEIPWASISAAIVQPLVTHTPTVVTYLHDDIITAREEVLQILQRAQKENAPRNAHEQACKYCKAKSVCGTAHAVIQNAGNLDTTKDKWLTYSPEHKLKLYELACLAEKTAGSVKTRCKEDLKNGMEIPGLRLKPGAEKRTVSDITKAYNLLSTSLPGMDSETFVKCCTVKISELDNTVARLRKENCPLDTKKPTVRESKLWLEALLSDVLTIKQNDSSIERSPS